MPAINVKNAAIERISSEPGTTFITITYTDRLSGGRNRQTVTLVANRRTIILNANGSPAPVSALRVGMAVNAAFSSAMTRSIPPQATAYIIQIIRPQRQDIFTTGRILDVSRNNQNFTTISDKDLSSIIRFNVSEDTRFFDRTGRPTNFSRLNPGMRVRVRHANFMTASIPPQTTAFEVRIL